MTGWAYNNEKPEIWPQPRFARCALPNFPLEVEDAVGFWTAQGPAVCGGSGGENKCFVYTEHQVFYKEHQYLHKEHKWMPWTNMGTARQYASALQVNPHQALIIGGYDENYNHLKTTELINSSGSEEGNKFPVTIAGHCSVLLPYQFDPCYGDGRNSRLVGFGIHLVCGLDHNNIHTRTNHENKKT